MKHKILVVDDEPLNVRLLERIFSREYQVLPAVSAQQALDLLKQHEVALIISDHRMPSMNGIEFLRRAAAMRPRVLRIIISGYADANVLNDAIKSGVIYRYISKPWNNEDFQQTIALALDHYEVIKNQHDLRRTNERLSGQIAALRGLIERFTGDIADLDDDTPFAVQKPPTADQPHPVLMNVQPPKPNLIKGSSEFAAKL